MNSSQSFTISLRATITFLLSVSFSSIALAQEQRDEKQPPCNAEAIDWVLPGDFEEALEKSREKSRLLLIKGLGFGLDELGAQCATQGCW